MKLCEVKNNMPRGTYAGVKFSNDTKQSIQDYIREARIPNAVDKETLHATLLYSRVYCPNYTPKTSVLYTGEPGEFNVWDTEYKGKKTKCLVLKFNCPELVERHKQLMIEHNATYDYPEYQPHITLSYDVGKVNPNSFPDIRKFLSTIEIVCEYVEDLEL